MKLRHLWITIALLALPVAIRTLWFYQGVFQPSEIKTPDYAGLEMPLPDLSTPLATNTGDAFSNSDPKPLVLIDAIHNNLFSLAEIEALTQNLTDRGAEVKLTTYDTLEDQLKKANAFIIIAPSMPFESWEIQTFSRFVNRGGRLLVITDPTRNVNTSDISSFSDVPSSSPASLSVDISNQVLEPFGISFIDDYLYNLSENEGNFRNILLNKFNEDDLTQNLSRVVFYSAHSIKTTKPGLIFSDGNTLSSKTDQGGDLVAAASTFEGRVLVIGDLTFMTTPYHQVADNAKLIDNISAFLTKTEKIHDLIDFPYLFRRPVTLLLSESIKLDKPFLDTLNDLRKYLVGENFSLTIGEKAVDGHDLFIIDTYPPAKELLPVTADFGLEFNAQTVEEMNSAAKNTPQPSPVPILTPQEENLGDEKETVNSVFVPGFGLLNASEIGLILFTSDENRNTLTILANSIENINILSGMLSSDLSSCNNQGNIAVCTFDGLKNSTDDNNYNFEKDYSSESDPYLFDETSLPTPNTTGTTTPKPISPVGGISWLIITPTPSP
jgi:hypothetical protein